MVTRKLVRAIVYDITSDGEKKYLLLKAKKGYWQNPQGGIDPGETETKALIREVQEETGLTIDEIHTNTRIVIEYDTERKGQPVNTILAAYAARADFTKKISLSSEDGHTAYKWVSHEEANKLLTAYPEQREVFENITQQLKN